MKKILAIVLSCMLIVGVVFALVLTSSAEENLATSVNVQVGGTMNTLTAENPTVNLGEGNGTVVFTAATGTLTLTNTKGIQKIRVEAADSDPVKNITIKVVGENVMTPNATGILYTKLHNVTFVGDSSANDKIVVDTTYGYVVLGDKSSWTLRNVGFFLTTTANACWQHNGGDVVLEGDTNVFVKCNTAPAFDLRVPGATLVVRDTAQLYAETADSLNRGGMIVNGDAGILVEDAAKITLVGNKAGDGLKTPLLTVKDNAVVDLSMKVDTACAYSTVVVNGKVKGDLASQAAIITATTASAPANVASSDVTASSAKITWDAVPNAVKYNVYSGTTLLKSVETNEATIDVLASTAYSITVKTVNAADVESAASAAATFTTPAGTPSVTAPAAPTNVAVSDIAETTATVTWTAVEGAASYEVYLGTNKVATVTEATAALTGLTAETNYSVTVKAVNVAGTSAASAAAAFTTIKAEPVEVLLDDVLIKLVGDETEYHLNAGNPQMTAGTGTVKFENGVLTLTNTTGIAKINLHGTAGDIRTVTVKVKGENKWDVTTQGIIDPRYVKATFVGDGSAQDKIVISSNNGYVFLGDSSDVVFKDVAFVAETTKNATFQLGNSTVTLEGDANLSIKCAQAPAFEVRFGESSLTVRDTAQLYVNSADSFDRGALVVNGVGILVEDNAKIKVEGNNDKDGLNTQKLTVKDNAVVELSMKVAPCVFNHGTIILEGKVAEGDIAGKAAIITAVNANSGNSGNSGTSNNPNTSDVSYTLAITLLSAAVLAAAAVVVIRKKSRKA